MTSFYDEGGVQLLLGDCREVLRGMPDESVHCCVSSPPYWGLRDYDCEGQLGLERRPEEFVERMVEVFREVRRLLRADGTLWLNLGDSYASSVCSNLRLKPKDLIGMPWRVAFALQADGWWLRSDTIWHKPCPMPESVTDRPTRSHEYVFLLSKSASYHYDADAVRTPLREKTLTTFGTRRQALGNDRGEFVKAHNFAMSTPERKPRLGNNGKPAGANLRSVWTIAPSPFKGAHFAIMPPKLVEPCILAGCPPGGTVLDPFCGAGTVPFVARELGRKAIGIELNASYCEIAANRLAQQVLDFG